MTAYILTSLEKAAPEHTRPTCLLCDAPLRPYLREVWIRVLAAESIELDELLKRAEQKIREFLHERPIASLYFVRCDNAALRPGRTRDDSFRVAVWVNLDYTGSEYIAGREAPCFCGQRCAVEFARLAASEGFRLRAHP